MQLRRIVMSLRPQLTEQIPDETVRIARAAFPKGTLCIRLRDELGPIFQDAMFASLYSHTGQPALSPWRLALVSVLQLAIPQFFSFSEEWACGSRIPLFG
jgi:transposase